MECTSCAAGQEGCPGCYWMRLYEELALAVCPGRHDLHGPSLRATARETLNENKMLREKVEQLTRDVADLSYEIDNHNSQKEGW